MDLTLAPEQAEIVATMTSFVARELPMAGMRASLDASSNRPATVWKACADLGWFGLGLPTDRGGVGYGAVEEALMFRELGRSLAPGPFLPTVLGARVAAHGGREDLAAAMVSGDTIVGLAERRTDGGLDLIDAADASIVVEVGPDGARVYAVDDLAAVTAEPCIDDATRLAAALLGDARPLARSTGPETHRRGTVLAAAMLAGIAEATRDLSVGYAKVREQYGKPIGSYQAIKHPCADMAVRAEAAAAQVFFAAVCVDGGRLDVGFQAAAAKVVAGDAALRNAAATVQVHGGIGFTFEHDAHLYVKRAHVLDHLFGGPRLQLATILASETIQ